MQGRITYLNTDLDLVSDHDLRMLANALDAGGVYPLHVTHGDDGRWYATFETRGEPHEPETHIAAMLLVVEALAPDARREWEQCSQREFNIGYDCGAEPWGFNQGLSAPLLQRMSEARASLRITIYPDRETSR